MKARIILMRHSKVLLQLICALLSAILLFSVCIAAMAADAQEAVSENDPSPIIYVIGRTPIYSKLGTAEEKETPDAERSEIIDAVKEALPYLAKAILLGQWDAYADKAYDLIMPFFEDFGLDQTGGVNNGSGVKFTWQESSLSKDYKSNNPYTYHFEYDSRLSPLEIADDLNDYIEAVKRVTGKDKVSLIGRCLGANVALSYVSKYQRPQQYAGLDSFVFYDQSVSGIEVLETAFSGSVKIDPTAAGVFLGEFAISTGNETLDKIIPLTFTMLRDTYGIEITAKRIQNIYDHIRDTAILRFIKSTFGSCPGYWSMVKDGYEQAKNYIFGADGDKETYKVLLDKIDAYREIVQLHCEDMIAEMQQSSVQVAAICKYGFSAYPLSENAKYLSDGVTGLKKQSFGATVSETDATLGAADLAAADPAYLSPDKQVDGSTALLKDTTWYIKNYKHNSFWNSLHPLLCAICRVPGFDVSSDPNYPQFLMMESGGQYNVFPMTVENCDPDGAIVRDGDTPVKKTFFTRMRAILHYFAAVVKVLLGR